MSKQPVNLVRRNHCAVVAMVVLLLTGAHARAAVEATLFGPDLLPQRVTLQSLRNNVVSYFGEDRQYRSSPVKKLLQLRCEHAAVVTKAVPGMIELTDGQRISGALLGASTDGQALLWSHPALGDMTIAIDRLRSLRRTADAPAPAATNEDRVTFTNGDQMAGFIASLIDNGVRLRLPRQDAPVDLTFDRIALVEFANPVTSPDRTQHLVHLVDGSRVRYDTVAIEGGAMVLGADQQARIDVESLLRIDFGGGDTQLTDLNTLPFEVIDGGKVFGMPAPPRVEGGVLRLHAPIVVRFDLPPGTSRAAMRVELDVDLRSPARWADVEVIISGGDGSPTRVHLSAEQRDARVNLPVTADTLTVQLDAAANGPVMDRVRLREAVVLVRSNGGE